ncbi:polyribonucleotide nucleotidyltransferase [Brevibacillus sp. SYP-B805]|uniref:polyribonucleotide nucleotidyltransferase n=1 Tax=Brevibacillus sp. SYP-B805 TaxID=1578199 RepID=UPI0013FC88F2|nr:polyribonucleotide nucleotidyltransferase [Brevibacillus sp. SYP-B805]NGQ95657.1 polyribonucleotide nucleotidyltransferase [Brevibacillus sp. SYP-B805]
MDIGSFMSTQLSILQHTVNMALLNMANSSQAAAATAMIQNLTQTQAITQAPHPFLGIHLDIKI